jgi:hypothetical protein
MASEAAQPDGDPRQFPGDPLDRGQNLRSVRERMQQPELAALAGRLSSIVTATRSAVWPGPSGVKLASRAWPGKWLQHAGGRPMPRISVAR